MSQENHDRDDHLDNEQDDQPEQQEQEDNSLLKIPEGDFRKMKQGLSKANKEAEKRRLQAKELEEQLERYRSFGELDELEERLQSQQAQQEQQREDMIPKAELEKSRKSLLAEQKKLQEQYETREKELQGKYSRTLVEREAVGALSKHGGKTKFLLPEVSNQISLVDNDGKYDFRVVDDTGEPRFNNRGEYMTIEELVKEMREHEDYSFLFDAPKKQGSGIQNQSGNRSSKPQPKVSKADLDVDAKAEYIGKNGYSEPKFDGAVPYKDLP